METFRLPFEANTKDKDPRAHRWTKSQQGAMPHSANLTSLGHLVVEGEIRGQPCVAFTAINIV